MTQSDYLFMSPSYTLYYIRTGKILKDTCNVWLNDTHYVVNCTDFKSLRLGIENLIKDLEGVEF